MSFPCAQCGRHAFPAPGTVCYWCRHPLTDEQRATRIAQGITHAVVTPPATKDAIFEAERQRLHERRKSFRKRPLT